MKVCGILDWCFWGSEAGATIVAALLAALVAVGGYAWQQRQSRADKRAVMYSEALRAVEDYAEAPFIVRRRSGKDARATVSAQISEIQSRLAMSCALLEISANHQIAAAYQQLVRTTRKVAGAAMSAAWRAPRIRRDSDLPGHTPYDRSSIDNARAAYLNAIREHDHSASRRING
ncbi:MULTISPECIES: hypothetical protein [unclassified Microbacterium]|uniref:hypothetical protein n=1 Tax=unclassified Microbacterium TaxID=2609290 RepID=UPI001ACC9DA2|nr:hypothetical protein [Microbacterium sp.]MBN9159216.1 hypothetical protein [Microbacterium sp.]